MSPPWTVTEQTSDMKGGATEESVLVDMTHWVINLHQKKAQAPNSAFSNKIRAIITLVLVVVATNSCVKESYLT